MRWIVGLGNPGPAYERTRHNAGFMVVDELARRWNAELRPHARCRALLGEARPGDVRVALLKPQTFMNLSGESVRAFMDYFKADLGDAIIVYDDMDTEVGRIRLRLKGGPGGHKGIESIIRHTGTETFNRIRLGISRPPQGMDAAEYVLSPFARSEWEAVNRMIAEACDAAEFALTHPFEETMAKFNRKSA